MEQLAIIGCGTMGHSIALNAAWKGMPVRLQGIDETDTGRALTGINSKLESLVTNNMVEQNKVRQILDRISFTVALEEAIDQASFIIEAIPENIGMKQQLFQYLDKRCGGEVILASNTSGLSTSAIASNMKITGRFIVTHFWNPAHLIPLVEVVRGPGTDTAVVRRTVELLVAMDKKPIEIRKEAPGFVGNRLQYALFREAQHILQEGIASKEDIDAAVTYGFGRRLPVTGPLLSADMGGLDVFAAISDYLFSELSNADASLPELKRLVAEGKLGAKSGEGFYEWDASFSGRMNARREIDLMRYLEQDNLGEAGASGDLK